MMTPSRFNPRLLCRLAVLSLAGGALVLNTGCAMALIGVGIAGKRYMTAEVKTVEQVPLNRAYQAAQSALVELDYDLTEISFDETEGRIKAKMADGDGSVKVKVAQEVPFATEVRVRVGFFGNDEITDRIIASMRRQYWQ